MIDTWSDAIFREALQLIAEGVAESVGFEVAAISVLREDGMLEFAAIVGDEDVRRTIMGSVVPVEAIEKQVAQAESWGLFRFVPHERMSLPPEHIAYTPDLPALDDPDAWHPDDLLFAPIYDDSGALRALLSVDVPVDRRRPGPRLQELMQRYAEQTRRAVLTAVGRDDAHRRLELISRARDLVRGASTLRPAGLLELTGPVVMEALEADGMWIESLVFDEPERAYWLPDPTWRPAPAILDLCRTLAQQLWQEQRVVVARAGDELPITVETEPGVRAALDLAGDRGLLMVPLGVDDQCVGYFFLVRGADGSRWSAAERDTALELGRDLGRALLNARLYAKEQQVVEELRRIDETRRTFVRTLAHELKNPLAAIVGHTSVTRNLPLPPQAASSLRAISEAAGRIGGVIDDLLILSSLIDPQFPAVRMEVDLRQVVTDAVQQNRVLAYERDQTLSCEACADCTIRGSETELFRAVTNLIGNAIRYTQVGGTIQVRVRCVDDGCEVAVQDNGPGIQGAEREHVWESFFRGATAVGQDIPGTGLGLSIVAQVAARHDGRAELSSSSGEGSTFTMTLPR